MRILLTGASGVIGKELLRYFIQKGHSVIALVRNPSTLNNINGLFKEQLSIVNCDLNGNLECIPKDYELVVHAAAYSSSNNNVEDHIENNINGSYNLIKQVIENGGRRKKTLVFLSSISVYGDIRDPVLTEKSEILNPGSYGISKLMIEMLLLKNSKNINSIVIRLPGVIGPGAYVPWLAQSFTKIKDGFPVEIYNPHTQFNNSLHVNDLGSFICSQVVLQTKGFDIVNLAASDPKHLNNIIEIMAKYVNKNLKIINISPKKNSFTISIDKVKNKYKFIPMTIFDTVKKFAFESKN